MSWGNPNSNPRAILFRFADGRATHVKVDDSSTFQIDGQTFAIDGLTEIMLEAVEIAELEEDVFGTVIDPGRPVADWGK